MRDYYGELIQLAATGDPRAIAVVANDFGREIQTEISELQQQYSLVIQMREYLMSKVTDRTDAEAMDVEAKEIPSLERPTRIKEVAMALVGEGHKTLTVKMVVERLEQMQLELDVHNPGAVIGTVLSNLSEFTRTAVGRFEYQD